MSRPIVAIVGRPNVGKSTLFNRLAGERIAIVEDLPGTTRDRICTDTSWWGAEVTLVDTGGLEPRPTSDMRQKIKDQVEIAIEEADVILLVADVRDGVTPLDLEVADMLRRSAKPIVLVANKADSPAHQSQAFEFYELGIGDPLPISAYHGTGTDELVDKVVRHLPPPSPAAVEPEAMKIAIVGRPNVGKSLLLNAILGQERAIVSDAPGTTRDAIDTSLEYEAEPMLLIDTAGIRRRGRVEGGVERYSVLRSLRAIGRSDVVLLITEATEVITAQDMHIAGYIQQSFKGMVLVVNKWDLVEIKDTAEYIAQIRRRLKFMPHTPILFVSAKLGSGVNKILPTAREIWRQRQRRLPTSALNSLIAEVVAAHSPPPVGGRRLNILYATQAGVNPPTFVFFVNDAKLVHFSYKRYLVNSLRQAFGFTGTPLRLNFKSRGEA